MAVTSSAVSSMVSVARPTSLSLSRVVRPVTYTVAPAAPSWTAMPRPAPRVAPATRQIRPRRLFSGCAALAPPASFVSFVGFVSFVSVVMHIRFAGKYDIFCLDSFRAFRVRRTPRTRMLVP